MSIESYDKIDVFVPDFEILVGGAKLSPAVRADVLQVSYHDSVDSLDGFEFELDNWDSETRQFKYSSSSQFEPGQKAELKLGYANPELGLTAMTLGQIVALSPVYPTDGTPRLTVSAVNALHELRREPRSESYFDKKDSQVASTVAQRLGLKVRTDSGASAGEPVLPYLLQDNQYDIDFLLERAQANDYELVMDADGVTLYFGPSESKKLTLIELSYGSGRSLSFSPSLSVVDQVEEVVVRYWDPTATGAAGGKSDARLLEAVAKRKSGAFSKAYAKRRQIVVKRTIQNQKEAQRLADSLLQSNEDKMFTASGEIVGMPEIRAGVRLKVKGIDSRFDAEYFVTSSRHTLSGKGYTTQFECSGEL